MKNVFLVRRFSRSEDMEAWLNKLPAGSGVAALSEYNEPNFRNYCVIVWIPQNRFNELPSNWEEKR